MGDVIQVLLLGSDALLHTGGKRLGTRHSKIVHTYIVYNNVSLSSTLERIRFQNSKSLWISPAFHTRDESCEISLNFLNLVYMLN